MALDALALSLVCREIEAVAMDMRIAKIHQLSKEELVFSLSGRGPSVKLFLSARADGARLHLSGETHQNPSVPPMLCMLLRKYLGGGKLVGVSQPGCERIVYLDFLCTDELRRQRTLRLAVEIMGRHSNIILVGEDGKIIDAVKRVGIDMSSVRPILPGGTYTPPPAQNKRDTLAEDAGVLARAVADVSAGDLHKALMKTLCGISPAVAGELEWQVNRGGVFDPENGAHVTALEAAIAALQRRVSHGESEPTAVLDKDGAPRDFSFLPLHQFGEGFETRRYESMGAMLDAFYTGRDRYFRTRQKSGDLFTLLSGKIDRVARRIAAQKQELGQSENREKFRIQGDLLQANLYNLQKGQDVAEVVDYFSESQEIVKIKLDPRLTPAQNAQQYFKKYRKLCTAAEKLRGLIEAGEGELRYLESVHDALTRATGEDDLAAISEELRQQGYIRRGRGKQNKVRGRGPLRFVTDDGYTVLVGRNNEQNDRLSVKEAAKTDIWFHTKDIAGSHAILLTDGAPFEELPDRVFTQAAIIAATHSKAAASDVVAVDYTLAKNIKKPPAAKPGMVIFHQNYTAYVSPDEVLCKRLQQPD